MTEQNVFSDLQWRGLVYQWTGDEELKRMLTQDRVTFYIGFDPSADSLTVGHLLQLMLMRRLQKAGHRPIAVVGGATGMIGDPGGRSSERNLLSVDELAYNTQALRNQIGRFLDFGDDAALMADNASWLSKFGFIDFLRDIGKHVTVNTMLTRDSVKIRLAAEQGISYTEFSYMLMQAFDFVHLNREFGCVLQCAGSDQFGNIVAGIDLAHRLDGTQLYGLTTPLITRSDGQKMGKSAQNAIWLDAGKTSPFRFHQWFLNVPDQDAGPFLRYFTELSHEEIEALEEAVKAAPARRDAQKKLADEVTSLVHGQEGLAKAQRAAEILFGGDPRGLRQDELLDIFENVPSTSIPASRLDGSLNLSEAVALAGLAPSRTEARRRIDSGGIYVNGDRVDADRPLTQADLATEEIAVLRSGKKSLALLRFVVS